MIKNAGKRATRGNGAAASSCLRVDVAIDAVGNAELEFPGGVVMSLHITPRRLSAKMDRSGQG